MNRHIARLCICAATLPALAAAAVTPVTVGDSGNEPVIAYAPDGTLYISALQYFYRSTDRGAHWTLLPGPPIAATVLASDSSISVDPHNRVYFSFDYPYAGATAVCTSDDRGDTWLCNPSAVPGGTDRMWVFAPGPNESYLVTNEGLYQTLFLGSTDGGLTWMPEHSGPANTQPQTGPLLRRAGSNLVLQPLNDFNNGLSLYVFDPQATSEPFASATYVSGLGPTNGLPAAAVTTDGRLYLTSVEANDSGGTTLLVAKSANGGEHWTVLPPVGPAADGASTFLWPAGGRPGHVGVIYFHTPDNADPANALTSTWSAVWAETYNADSADPIWSATTLDEGVHFGAICAALSCAGDARFAGDFISSVIEPDETVHLSWMTKPPNAATALVRYAQIPANRPPLAALTATPTRVARPKPVQFSGAASSDPDGEGIARYVFDFGDGSPVLTQTSALASHAYATSGHFTATLRVLDARGLASTATASVALLIGDPPPPNARPIPALSAAPLTGKTPLTVRFDASASHDPDAADRIITYHFNFGDGSPALSQASPVATHTYTRGGSFTTALSVIDNHHALSNTLAKVKVTVAR